MSPIPERNLRVVAVDSWKRTRQFLELPHQVHATPISRWIAPLKIQERLFMGSLKGKGRGFWMVLDGDRPVARIGACLHGHQDGERVHFGFFECLEGYPEAVPLLVDRAAQLAPGLELHGPYSFEMEDPYTGILVEGFEYEPTFLVSYNPPFYGDYLEEAGFESMMDLYSYRYTPETVNLERMASRARRAEKKGVSVRMMERSKCSEEMRNCIEIADIAWAENWGFEVFKEEQIQALILFARVFFDRRGILLAQHAGRDIGFAWILGNFNQFLRESRGKLTLKMIWQVFMRRDELRTLRGYALGVLPEFQHIPVAAALIHAIMQKGHEYSWEELDLSWVLASNIKMNALARALGGQHHKTHRLYKRRSHV